VERRNDDDCHCERSEAIQQSLRGTHQWHISRTTIGSRDALLHVLAMEQ
jgi:hypothetical protein